MPVFRLFVTDLDGCLLRNDGSLPADFDGTWELLRSRGAVLAGVSGRSVRGLTAPFGARASEMAFASDNGSCLYWRGEPLRIAALPDSVWQPVVREGDRHPGLICVGCGAESAWIERPQALTARETAELRKYFPEWRAGRPGAVPDRIIKLAFLFFNDMERSVYPFFRRFDGDTLRVRVTAYVWMDVFSAAVSKGTAVQALQKALGIAPEETVVFGDYLNDLPMAGCAALSLAPANAHPRVKERFSAVIPSNEAGGVTAAIRSLLRGEPPPRG